MPALSCGDADNCACGYASKGRCTAARARLRTAVAARCGRVEACLEDVEQRGRRSCVRRRFNRPRRKGRPCSRPRGNAAHRPRVRRGAVVAQRRSRIEMRLQWAGHDSRAVYRPRPGRERARLRTAPLVCAENPKLVPVMRRRPAASLEETCKCSSFQPGALEERPTATPMCMPEVTRTCSDSNGRFGREDKALASRRKQKGPRRAAAVPRGWPRVMCAPDCPQTDSVAPAVRRSGGRTRRWCARRAAGEHVNHAAMQARKQPYIQRCIFPCLSQCTSQCGSPFI